MSDDAKSKVRTAGRGTREETARLPVAREQGVYCRRIDLPIPVAEHATCPYCFGKEADIRTGDHERFCDFQEGKDPICFGFPWS